MFIPSLLRCWCLNHCCWGLEPWKAYVCYYYCKMINQCSCLTQLGWVARTDKISRWVSFEFWASIGIEFSGRNSILSMPIDIKLYVAPTDGFISIGSALQTLTPGSIIQPVIRWLPLWCGWSIHVVGPIIPRFGSMNHGPVCKLSQKGLNSYLSGCIELKL